MEETKSAPDHRYESVRFLIEKRTIKCVSDIFQFIPRMIVAENLGQSYELFVSKINQPWRFNLDELTELAALVGVSLNTICELLERDIKDKRKPKRLKPILLIKPNFITR
jgi:hypothetical protein